MSPGAPNLRGIRFTGRLVALIVGGAAGVALPLLLGVGLYRWVVWLLSKSG